jgi:hypothetical protein
MVINFFVGGSPGQVARVYIRAVNTSQQAQAWQLIDTRTVASTWAFTTTGTIGDGTLLGTGGPGVYSGSTGRLGIGGTQTSSGLSTVGLADFRTVSGDHSWVMQNTTPTSGRQYGVQNLAATGFLNSDFTAGLVRTYLNSSGQLGIGGSPGAQLQIFGGWTSLNSTTADAYLTDTTPTTGRSYATINESGAGSYRVWDSTGGAVRTIINSSGNYSLNGSASSDNQFTVVGGSARMGVIGSQPYMRLNDTGASGRIYGPYSHNGYLAQYDETAGSDRTLLSNVGYLGVGGSPGQLLSIFSGTSDVGLQITAPEPSVFYTDTTTSGRQFQQFNLPSQFGTWDATAGSTRTYISTSGGFGIGGNSGADFAHYNSARAYFQNTGPGIALNDTQVSGRLYMALSGSGLAQAYTIYDGTRATYPVEIDNAGNYGHGGAPSVALELFGNPSRVTASGAYTAMNDTGGSGRVYYFQSSGGTQYTGDQTSGGSRLFLNSSGQYGIGAAPSYPLQLSGDVFLHSGASASNELQGTNVGGRTFETATGAAHAMSDGQYGWNDVTGGVNRTRINNSGQYGIGGDPGNRLDVFGQYSRTAGPGGGWLAFDTNTSGIGAYFLSGNVAAGNVSINRDGSGNVAQWNATGMGVGGTPTSKLHVFGNPYIQASQVDVRYQNTEASGRTFGFGSSSGWDGVGYYQMAIDHTAGALRTRMDSTGQVGINRTPSYFLDSAGSVSARSGSGGYYYEDRSNAANVATLYASSGYPRLFWNSADFATFNPSTGAMGLGGTYSSDWISVQGVSILDSNKVLQAGLANSDKVLADGSTWGRTPNSSYGGPNAKLIGFQINPNPDFFGNSSTGYSVYDNAGSGNVTLSLLADTAAPNGSGYKLKVHTASGGTPPAPGLGGFFLGFTQDSGQATVGQYHRGDTIIWRVLANIPVGYSIQWASNATGTGSTFTWLTSRSGTGNWFIYIGKQVIGTSGTFSSTGFFYLDTGAAPVDWYVASVDAVDIDMPHRYTVASIDGNHKALVDFNSSHVNKTLDFVPNGTRCAWDTTTQKSAAVDSNGNLLLKNLSQTSPSTSSPSTTSGTYSTVPETTVTITTKGNKVLVMHSGVYYGGGTAALGTMTLWLAVFRDGTQVSPDYRWDIMKDEQYTYKTYALTYLDTGASAASHTFDIRWKWAGSSGTGGNGLNTDRYMQVVELG